MSNSITSYSFKTIEAEDYTRDKLSPNQIAKQRSMVYNTPDPDVLEHVTAKGITKTYENKVNPDGTTTRIEVSNA